MRVSILSVSSGFPVQGVARANGASNNSLVNSSRLEPSVNECVCVCPRVHTVTNGTSGTLEYSYKLCLKMRRVQTYHAQHATQAKFALAVGCFFVKQIRIREPGYHIPSFPDLQANVVFLLVSYRLWKKHPSSPHPLALVLCNIHWPGSFRRVAVLSTKNDQFRRLRPKWDRTDVRASGITMYEASVCAGVPENYTPTRAGVEK